MAISENTGNPTGLFRTPLSCALLSGALTVAVYEFFRLAVWPRLHGGSQLLIFINFLLYSAMQLQGPVLTQRDRTTLVRSFVMALAQAVLMYGCFILIPWQWFAVTTATIQGMVRGMVIRNAVASLICALVLAALLARLYRVKQLTWVCCGLTMLAVLPMLAIYTIQVRVPGSNEQPAVDSLEIAAMRQMLTYLSTIAMVVLPTIPIDRALRRKQAQRVNENAPREAGRLES